MIETLLAAAGLGALALLAAFVAPVLLLGVAWWSVARGMRGGGTVSGACEWCGAVNHRPTDCPHRPRGEHDAP